MFFDKTSANAKQASRASGTTTAAVPKASLLARSQSTASSKKNTYNFLALNHKGLVKMSIMNSIKRSMVEGRVNSPPLGTANSHAQHNPTPSLFGKHKPVARVERPRTHKVVKDDEDEEDSELADVFEASKQRTGESDSATAHAESSGKRKLASPSDGSATTFVHTASTEASSTEQPVPSAFDVASIRNLVLYEFLPRYLRTSLQTGGLRTDGRSLAVRRHKAALMRALAKMQAQLKNASAAESLLYSDSDSDSDSDGESSDRQYPVLEEFLRKLFDSVWAQIHDSMRAQQAALRAHVAEAQANGDTAAMHEVPSQQEQREDLQRQLLLALDQRMREEKWLQLFQRALGEVGTPVKHANATMMAIVVALVSQTMRCRVMQLLSHRRSPPATANNVSTKKHCASSKHCGDTSGESEAETEAELDGESESGNTRPSSCSDSEADAGVREPSPELPSGLVQILFADPSQLVAAIISDIIRKDRPALEGFCVTAPEALRATSQYLRRKVLLAVYQMTSRGGKDSVDTTMAKMCWGLDRKIDTLLQQAEEAPASSQCRGKELIDKLTQQLLPLVMCDKSLQAAWRSVVEKAAEKTDATWLADCGQSDRLRVLVTFAQRYLFSRVHHYEQTKHFHNTMASIRSSHHAHH